MPRSIDEDGGFPLLENLRHYKLAVTASVPATLTGKLAISWRLRLSTAIQPSCCGLSLSLADPSIDTLAWRGCDVDTTCVDVNISTKLRKFREDKGQLNGSCVIWSLEHAS